MGKRSRTGSGPVVAALAALLLAGCGGADPAADGKPSPSGPVTNGIEKLQVKEIIDKAIKASAGAETAHAVGKIDADGLKTEIDMKLKGDDGGVGHMITEGQRVDLIRLDTVVYFKGDKAFWTAIAGKEFAGTLAGKWVKTTTKDKDMADLVDVTDAENLFEDSLDYSGGLPTKARRRSSTGSSYCRWSTRTVRQRTSR